MDIRARVFGLSAMDITSDRALPGCKPVPMLLAAPMFRPSDIGHGRIHQRCNLLQFAKTLLVGPDRFIFQLEQ